MLRRQIPASLVGVLMTGAACLPLTDEATGGQEKSGGPVAADALIVREGFYEADDRAARMRLEVKGVERVGGNAVLRFWVTNLDAGQAGGSAMFSWSRVDRSFAGFRLLDPVGRKLYHPLLEETGSAVGSHYRGTTLAPRVRYEAHVHFPALPQGVDRVTLLTPGTTAEIPGVPVKDGGSPPAAPTEQPTGTPAPGGSAVLAASPPSEARERKVEDLYDIVEGTTASTTSGGGGETITFPADVLFAFDSAALIGRARQIIAQAAADLKSRSDPAEPITIEGHTDGKGLLSRNQPLSEQRAAAVRDALARHLSGQGFDFQVSGKADSEPVAEETTDKGTDNPAGRARNRRVEIAYTLRPAQGADLGGGALKRGEPGEPAQPRDPGGRVVAERTATVDTSNGTGGEKIKLRLFPAYRDGAYLVLAFELTNIGPAKLNRVAGMRGYFQADDFVGGDYGSFRATAPDGTVYRAVRRGVPENRYVTPDYLTGSIILGYPNVPQRTYMYVPAPPRATTSLTLDAGAFGKIPGVPVR